MHRLMRSSCWRLHVQLSSEEIAELRSLYMPSAVEMVRPASFSIAHVTTAELGASIFILCVRGSHTPQ